MLVFNFYEHKDSSNLLIYSINVIHYLQVFIQFISLIASHHVESSGCLQAYLQSPSFGDTFELV